VHISSIKKKTTLALRFRVHQKQWVLPLCTLKMLGCFNPIFGQILTNPNVGLKNGIIKFNSTAGFVHI